MRKPDTGTCFVDYINRFVRQATASDITTGQVDRGSNGVVGDLDAVVFFVSFTESFEDRDRFFDRGWIDHDFLESTGQRAVFFNVLAIFIKRRGTDALNFAASQGWFEHVGGVDRAFGTAGTYQRMQFVNEQNRIFCAANFVHYRFDSLFKLTTILCSGDHHCEVQNHNPFFGEDLGNFAGD